MQRISLLCLFLALAMSAKESEARSARVSQIPNGSVLSCANCHVDPGGGGPRNAFGLAIAGGFLTSADRNGTVIWNAQLAGMDSDGDGVTNGQELGDPDGDGRADSAIQVTNPGDPNSFVPPVTNRAPVFAPIGAKTLKEGESLSFSVSATDEDKDAVTLVAGDLPTGATFVNGQFSWTPGFDQDGFYRIPFTASDGKDNTVLSVEVTIEDVSRPLVISSLSPARNLVVGTPGDTLRLTVSAQSPDRPSLTHTWTVNGVVQAESAGSLLLNVTAGDADDAVSVSVTDGLATLTQSWTVSKVLKGDFNGDNAVNFADFLLFVRQFGKKTADPDFNVLVDINGNGTVDFPDFLDFVRFFGLSR